MIISCFAFCIIKHNKPHCPLLWLKLVLAKRKIFAAAWFVIFFGQLSRHDTRYQSVLTWHAFSPRDCKNTTLLSSRLTKERWWNKGKTWNWCSLTMYKELCVDTFALFHYLYFCLSIPDLTTKTLIDWSPNVMFQIWSYTVPLFNRKNMYHSLCCASLH